MCKASYFPNNRTVVVKGFLSEGDANLKDISKEARMLQKVRCSKIAEFIGVCSKQIAIMIEYEYFDFPPFGLDHHLSDLLDKKIIINNTWKVLLLNNTWKVYTK